MIDWPYGTRTTSTSYTGQTTGTNSSDDATAIVAYWFSVQGEEPEPLPEYDPRPKFCWIRTEVRISHSYIQPRFMLLRNAGWRYRQRIKKSGRKVLMHRVT